MVIECYSIMERLCLCIHEFYEEKLGSLSRGCY